MRAWREFLSSVNFTLTVNFLCVPDYLLHQNSKLMRWLEIYFGWILESKLTAILLFILEAKLKAYEESMTFFNTSFETMKGKMDNLEKETKT